MLIYFVLLLSLFLLSVSSASTTQRRLCFYFLSVVLLFVGGYRSISVGGDNYIYNINFKFCNMNPETWSWGTEMEPGFSWLMAFFKTYICNDYQLFMSFIFFATMFCVCAFIKEESPNLCLSLFFLLLFQFYTQSFNLIRQCFAISLSFHAFFLLKNEFNYLRVFLYVFFVLLISIYIHRSIIVLLLIPLVYYTHLRISFQKDNFVIGMLTVSFLVVIFGSFFTSNIDEILPFISGMEDKYISYIGGIGNDDVVTISAWSALIHTLFAIYIVKNTPQNIKRSIFYYIYIGGILVANLMGALNVIFLRVSLVFTSYNIIFFALVWCYMEKSKKRLLFRISVCVYGLVFFIIAMDGNYNRVVPYVNTLFL